MKEYKIVEVKLPEAEAEMNELAREGWEVVSTSIYNGGAALTKAGVSMFITLAREA